MNIEELENKIKELQEELEKLKNKENKRWRAKKTEEYYFVTSLLGVGLDCDYCQSTDNSRYKAYNYFKTREETQAIVDNIKTHIELMELAEELNTEPIDWKNAEQEKIYLLYDNWRNAIFDYSTEWLKGANTVYCTNENFKNEAIKRIGEERLIKYLKG